MANQILSQQNSDENENQKKNENLDKNIKENEKKNKKENQLLVPDDNKGICNIEVKVHTHRALKISLIILGIIMVIAVGSITVFFYYK